MTDGEDPTYLDTPPEIAPEEPSTPTLATPPGHGLYRTPDRPRVVAEKPPVRVRMPEDEDDALELIRRESVPIPPPPDWLARLLGPAILPSTLIEGPRLWGALLLAFGMVAMFDLEEHRRIAWVEPYLAGITLVLGTWLVSAGRPADPRGYAPGWWNRGFLLMIGISLFVGLLLDTIYL